MQNTTKFAIFIALSRQASAWRLVASVLCSVKVIYLEVYLINSMQI